jgi:hypothetical protein
MLPPSDHPEKTLELSLKKNENPPIDEGLLSTTPPRPKGAGGTLTILKRHKNYL